MQKNIQLTWPGQPGRFGMKNMFYLTLSESRTVRAMIRYRLSPILQGSTSLLVLDLRHEFGSRYKLWLQNNLRASLVANLFSIIFPIFGHKWNWGKLFLEIIFQIISFLKDVYQHEIHMWRVYIRFSLYITIGHLLYPHLHWQAFAPESSIITKQYKARAKQQLVHWYRGEERHQQVGRQGE